MSEWLDEGPSEEDLDRFNRDQSGFCPECSAEVFDDAEYCTACGLQIGGRIANRPRVERDAQHRLTIIVIVLILLGFVGWVSLF